MLSDDELARLRRLFTDAAIATVPLGDRPTTWDDMVFNPSAEPIRAFVIDPAAPTDVKIGITQVLTAIGYACAGEVLSGVPLDLDRVPDRRWQLRRELARAVEAIDDAALQQLVYTARRLAPGALLEIDDPYLEEITAAIKLERSLRRAESNQRRHGTRVVATPEVVGGQVRIDGTRMPVTMLIIYLRSMTESEISREWAHLPPGWLDAIVGWIDGQRVSEGGE